MPPKIPLPPRRAGTKTSQRKACTQKKASDGKARESDTLKAKGKEKGKNKAKAPQVARVEAKASVYEATTTKDMLDCAMFWILILIRILTIFRFLSLSLI